MGCQDGQAQRTLRRQLRSRAEGGASRQNFQCLPMRWLSGWTLGVHLQEL